MLSRKYYRTKSRNSSYGKNWDLISDLCRRRSGYRCENCGEYFNKNKHLLHAHHIIPKSKGGLDTMENTKSLCIKCHSLEHNHMKAAY